ncbi:aldo/keto reductase [Sodiomyces alkalinus F11]|uniref:Aldo/keto reductase n=1 Tax=Sodiomyces alkalinus (strain CBS 110278 / VKM F-3762 / F11) TaxID=1314773 RepID=A0A3N2PZB4_SODAK|nr:aldo/keto reductase [Sodiomyces alkalinus F11]ROT39837.1 aldo/keto reductase [Sodiomyces alkalinus F11]
MPQIAGQEIGPRGFGLMNFTWRSDPVPDEQAFETMRAALDNGMNFWNAGEFYGTPEVNSMTLLNRYFEKYPEDADRVVVSMKGGLRPDLVPDGSPENIRRSLDFTLEKLGGRKKIDVFECARRDPNVPLETTFGVIEEEYIKTGKVGGICLSEVSAATIREAAKITTIAGVEVELSLFSTDVVSNGVAAACAELGIPLIAYSPLGRGMLTGRFKTAADIPTADVRHHLPRFQPENFETNLRLIRQVEDLAAKKGCTPAQLALGWLNSLSRRPGMPTIIPIPGSTTVDRVVENAKLVDLTDEEMAEIDATLAKFEVAGARYPDGHPINT